MTKHNYLCQVSLYQGTVISQSCVVNYLAPSAPIIYICYLPSWVTPVLNVCNCTVLVAALLSFQAPFHCTEVQSQRVSDRVHRSNPSPLFSRTEQAWTQYMIIHAINQSSNTHTHKYRHTSSTLISSSPELVSVQDLYT